MMLSLIAQRAAVRTPSLLAASIVRSRAPLFASTTVTRTFLTTPRLAYPPTKKATATSTRASGAAKSTTRKPAAKKPATRKAAAKKRAKPKKRATKPKAPERVRITAADKPPKKPAPPFLLFWKDYQQKNGIKIASLSEMSVYIKQAGEAWRGSSEAQKKPYVDAWEKAKETYYPVLAEYYKNVDSKKMREINRRRAAKGKRRLPNHKPRASSAYSFFMKEYMLDWYKTHPAPARVGGSLGECSKSCAAKWRSLSTVEKAPYIDASTRSKEALLANA
ncbi:hypothetical protein NM688_g4070 [Phlebia brevispora]|uniref:Uncharacterized protein n=1 Tax=Phlebia brevispora TaxID=194682 RepID=A0ACC1T443_9APHY|nr:hypothetical protein NM688_g4070 [Phlebia brevispora]